VLFGIYLGTHWEVEEPFENMEWEEKNPPPFLLPFST
jgi:hypothetical protein